MRVTVIGAGYVGAVSAAVFAHLGNRVTCVERDPVRLASWRRGTDPLAEPGLADLLNEVDVRFAPDASDVASADVVVIAVGTPMGDDGRPDLTQVDTAALQIGALARPGAVVLMRSTVPVGTCDRLQSGPLERQRVVSNPEFLREGHALRDAFFPDRIVAGGAPDARDIVEDLYRAIIDRHGLPRVLEGDAPAGPVPLRWMSAASAELAKYAANGFLATKLSFANEISNLAHAVGADASAVLGSMGLDPRIGSQFLRPGLGWGGSCFPKDTRALQCIADGMGYDFLVLKAAIEQNVRQLRRFAAAIEGTLPRGASVGLLGLTFKAGTADTRESPAIALAQQLLRAGLVVNAYDPALRHLPGEVGIRVRSSIAEACDAVDAVVIATEWAEFAGMDLRALRRVTRGDLLFDGRSLIAPASAAAAGFRYAGPAGFADPALDRTAVRSSRLGTAA
ncbi:MAG TPA: UDP-glucose/GDP-mannose dehydrogenase family protein [Gemmatimonadaceae bacterium]|nr:UDP-glucose/GDP-mannose dehydrogenase family protein [Gemmatimonadaceae bacterium]